MVGIYVALIKASRKRLEDVPMSIREAVAREMDG